LFQVIYSTQTVVSGNIHNTGQSQRVSPLLYTAFRTVTGVTVIFNSQKETGVFCGINTVIYRSDDGYRFQSDIKNAGRIQVSLVISSP
jgi:hypothetical protein